MLNTDTHPGQCLEIMMESWGVPWTGILKAWKFECNAILEFQKLEGVLPFNVD